MTEINDPLAWVARVEEILLWLVLRSAENNPSLPVHVSMHNNVLRNT